MSPYEAITGDKPNISYIKIIGSLTYSLIPKEKRLNTELGKLANKANQGILVGFESSNNFLTYIPTLNQVISTRDITIKEDLVYKDNIIVKEDYSKLLEESSPDYNITIPYNNNNNITSTIEDSTSDIIKTSNNTSIVEDITEIEEEDEDLDELNPDYNINTTRRSTRISSQEPTTYRNAFHSTSSNTTNTNNLYALASRAYLGSKSEE
jgi:hypothetical protein